MPHARSSLWLQALRPRYPRLESDLEVDVAVVGAGVTGLTTAWLLQREGVRVALLDATRVGQGASGATSAHLTLVPDRSFTQLLAELGPERGRLLVDGYREGMALMLRFTRSLEEEGVFLQRLPAYRYGDDKEAVTAEAGSAQQLGVEADVVAAPAPFARTAVRFPEQAQLHPVLYLNAMARKYREAEGLLFEGSRVTALEVRADGVLLTTRRGSVAAGYVVLATHSPGEFELLGSELSQLTTYLLAFAGKGPEGLFWEFASPYHYWRTLRWQGKSYVLVGGEDHKTTHRVDPEDRFAALEEYARKRCELGPVVSGWADEIYHSRDGLPFIGRSIRWQRVLLAAGFAGNGLAAGSLAGQMLADELLGRSTPWSKLFSARRLIKPQVVRHFDKTAWLTAWPGR